MKGLTTKKVMPGDGSEAGRSGSGRTGTLVPHIGVGSDDVGLTVMTYWVTDSGAIPPDIVETHGFHCNEESSG